MQLRAPLLTALCLALATQSARAQFAIDWSTIDCGGGRLTGGTFSLDGTIGQSDAVDRLSGGSFSITGGFWAFTTDFAGCPADVDDGTATGSRDGGVTIEDLLYYLFIFGQGIISADVDDGSGTGVRDGGVTIEDLLFYLARFQAGC